MKRLNGFVAVAACAAGLLGASGAANAVPEPVPGPWTGTTSAGGVCAPLTLGQTLTVIPALTGGYCYGQVGNLQDADITSLGFLLIEKDEQPAGQEDGLLEYTQNGPRTSGTWTFGSALWSTYETLYLATHFGGGQGDPDSFIVQLAPYNTTGTWTFSGPNGLSNIYLLGKLCPVGAECGPPDEKVPEPGTLALLGLGLLGLGLQRRKA